MRRKGEGMIDEPEQDEPTPNERPEKMTEQLAEQLRAGIELIHELTSGMGPPMDPRAFGLLEMAADLLLEQIETGRLYYPDTEEKDSAEIQAKLNQVQKDLTLLQSAPNKPSKSLGDQMEEDIHKFFEQTDMLPDEEEK